MRRQRVAMAMLPWLMSAASCVSTFEARHETLSDARLHIWLAEDSQVMLRSAQSRIFASADRSRLLAAILQTMQDLGFMVEALDTKLGIVSGSRFDPIEGNQTLDPTYHVYDGQSLLLLTRTYRSWGPFFHRANLVRLTVTVRSRNEAQTVVRANAQFHLRAVETTEPYQRFFAALEQAMAMQSMQLPEEPPATQPVRGDG
jgi:hypothetical protein